ncbi:hypothetical protein [Providencia rettgeri]|uniref:hypothetical protein n=1 Tax=Providencia rettgeri TaxID=587 RepID=UPI00301022D0
MQMKAYFKAIEYQLSNFSQEQDINLTKAVLVCKKAQEEIEQNSGPLTPEGEHKKVWGIYAAIASNSVLLSLGYQR